MKLFYSKIGDEDDGKLLRRYHDKKDQQAYAILYKRYSSLVYGLCLKYLKDSDQAQDAVMDIFVKVGEKLLTQEVSHFKSWLYTVSKNHCFEVLRKKKRVMEKENEARIMYSGHIFHPDDVREDESVWSRLEKCMENLSQKQKACIEMFYLQSKNYKFITEALKLSWAQVRSNIQNGRRNLKICMEKNEEGA